MNYTTGLNQTWTASGKREPMTAVMRQQIAQAKIERQQERQQAHQQAAEKARHIWGKTAIADLSHPYLARKRIKPHGAKLSTSGALIVPLYDDKNNLVNLQFIHPDGSKRFLKDGRKKGCFSMIGGKLSPQSSQNRTTQLRNRLLICEGFATGASLRESTGYPVLVAMDAGNLVEVARTARRLFPIATIVICGDNDESGVGQKAAKEAAAACGGHCLIPPQTGDDWNDVLTMVGV